MFQLFLFSFLVVWRQEKFVKFDHEMITKTKFTRFAQLATIESTVECETNFRVSSQNLQSIFFRPSNH